MIRRNLPLFALLLSVGLNLFLLGGIGMRLFQAETRAAVRPFPPSIGWILRDLDEERRAQLRELAAPFAEEIRPLRRDMLAAQRRVNALMAAPDYDGEALAAAFAELREASRRYADLSHRQTAVILGELSADERRAALEFVRRRGPRDGGGPRRGGRPDRTGR